MHRSPTVAVTNLYCMVPPALLGYFEGGIGQNQMLRKLIPCSACRIKPEKHGSAAGEIPATAKPIEMRPVRSASWVEGKTGSIRQYFGVTMMAQGGVSRAGV
jgi:hypothetical protein